MGQWRVKKKDDNVQCSLIKPPVIFMEPVPKCKIELLMDKYPHQEWIGYLVGRVLEKENYFVEDLSIPPHKEVSASSAEAEPFHIPSRCIGIIHSHGTGGAFHSPTDDDYVDRNFPISITVSKRNQSLEFDAVSHQRTPCGKDSILKGCVKYVQPKPLFDSGTFLVEAAKNISKGKKTVVIHYSGLRRYVGSPQSTGGQLPYSDFIDTEYVVDDKGRAISMQELGKHLKEIWRD